MVFLLALPGVLALVLDPAAWLWRSWQDPSYQSDGMIVAAITLALLVVSVASGSAPTDARDRRRAWIGLLLTAAVRLTGRLLAVNTVGALALVIDVWAVSVLLGVRRRPFALHPIALALFFAFALPVEHLAQRILGHPLQLLAAATSERVLSPFFPDLVREGVLLIHPSVELAVDLPCSGARGLVLLAALALGLWTCRAPGVIGAFQGCMAVLLGAFVANAMRIIALFVGGAYGAPIIEEPWHSSLGAGVLALGAVPLLLVAAHAPGRRPHRAPLSAQVSGVTTPAPSFPWPIALILSTAGIAIASAPAHPLDITPRIENLRLPTTLGRFDGFEVPLLDVEQRYYDQWGGFAQKRIYDDQRGEPITALLVRTRSPLRHLHGPDVCLGGAGHQVTRIGVVPGATPVVLYRSVAPDGSEWRIEASFVNDRGEAATSVSEVVWRWLEEPEMPWSLVERITPWTACEASPERCRDFEGALFASLDLPMENRR
jgi:exosortase/archaeosortase family protein